jgi:hypothetical protein
VSRRHHGGRPHRTNGHARPTDAFGGGPPAPAERAARPPINGSQLTNGSSPALAEGEFEAPDRVMLGEPAPVPIPDEPGSGPVAPHHAPPIGGPTTDDARRLDPSAPQPEQPGPNGPRPFAGDQAAVSGCTAPQLRRFIKSRPYVPMHELRRRFGINGGEDEVTLVRLGGGQVFVGLPDREGALLGELLRGGDIGYELSLDPRSPIVVGLYPMRPVARS